MTTEPDEIEKLRSALARIQVRSTPHKDDTDEDRRRDLFHINALATAALRVVSA